jgi:CheY-like chemotaxis protein
MYPKPILDQPDVSGVIPTPEVSEKKATPVKRVLLAESSSVSRNVALHILAKLGYQVDHVSNGWDALRSAQRGNYDLLILDTDLPEMDGYAVTRAMRSLADGERNLVPIIALTSSAAQQDRELREAAGMNDYIVKPLRPRSVASVLARWDASAAAIAPPMAIDREMLASLWEVLGDQNPALLEELVELFQESTPARLMELREALKRRDAKTMREVAHTINGTAGQLGAVRMTQTCASIETLARAGSLKGTRELLDQLDRDFARACSDLLVLAGEGFRQCAPAEASAQRMTLDLAALRESLAGKRVIAVHAAPQMAAQLRAALEAANCRVELVSESDDCSADLLFWAGDIDDLAKFREKDSATPVIALLNDLHAPVLDQLRTLDADFVVEPFRATDLQLRAYLSLSAVRSPVRADAKGQKSTSVLVAEDDPLIARFLVALLQGAGFQVTLAVDGGAALDALAQKRFDVAILDINMPKVDGFGVLSQLRLRPESRNIPVLMLSARVDEHDIVKAFDLGAEDYVTKPFNPLEVISRVRRLARIR